MEDVVGQVHEAAGSGAQVILKHLEVALANVVEHHHLPVEHGRDFEHREV